MIMVNSLTSILICAQHVLMVQVKMLHIWLFLVINQTVIWKMTLCSIMYVYNQLETCFFHNISVANPYLWKSVLFFSHCLCSTSTTMHAVFLSRYLCFLYVHELDEASYSRRTNANLFIPCDNSSYNSF